MIAVSSQRSAEQSIQQSAVSSQQSEVRSWGQGLTLPYSGFWLLDSPLAFWLLTPGFIFARFPLQTGRDSGCPVDQASPSASSSEGTLHRRVPKHLLVP